MYYRILVFGGSLNDRRKFALCLADKLDGNTALLGGFDEEREGESKPETQRRFADGAQLKRSLVKGMVGTNIIAIDDYVDYPIMDDAPQELIDRWWAHEDYDWAFFLGEVKDNDDDLKEFVNIAATAIKEW